MADPIFDPWRRFAGGASFAVPIHRPLVLSTIIQGIAPIPPPTRPNIAGPIRLLETGGTQPTPAPLDTLRPAPYFISSNLAVNAGQTEIHSLGPLPVPVLLDTLTMVGTITLCIWRIGLYLNAHRVTAAADLVGLHPLITYGAENSPATPPLVLRAYGSQQIIVPLHIRIPRGGPRWLVIQAYNEAASNDVLTLGLTAVPLTNEDS